MPSSRLFPLCLSPPPPFPSHPIPILSKVVAFRTPDSYYGVLPLFVSFVGDLRPCRCLRSSWFPSLPCTALLSQLPFALNFFTRTHPHRALFPTSLIAPGPLPIGYCFPLGFCFFSVRVSVWCSPFFTFARPFVHAPLLPSPTGFLPPSSPLSFRIFAPPPPPAFNPPASFFQPTSRSTSVKDPAPPRPSASPIVDPLAFDDPNQRCFFFFGHLFFSPSSHPPRSSFYESIAQSPL